jgi:hypothetical protein
LLKTSETAKARAGGAAYEQIASMDQRLPYQLLGNIVHPHLPFPPTYPVALIAFVLPFDEQGRDDENAHECLNDDSDRADQGA